MSAESPSAFSHFTLKISPLAGHLPPPGILLDVSKLITAILREAAANAGQKKKLSVLTPDKVVCTELGGEKVESIIDRAPGNNAPIGGIKVSAATGWFAARPSGTKDIYKIYVESFRGRKQLDSIVEEAQSIVDKAIA